MFDDVRDALAQADKTESISFTVRCNDARAMLTELQARGERIAVLEAEVAKLEALVIGYLDLLAGPDEQGAYVHQRQLIEASMPIKARVCVRRAMEKK